METSASRVAMLAFALVLSGPPLHAADINDLVYEIRGDAVTIIGCDTAASGDLVIPSEIEEKPVTTISFEAFMN